MQQSLRIVLVNTVMETRTFPKIGFITPPYWAAVLASKIRGRGHDAALIDLQFQDPKRRVPNIPRKYYEKIDAVFVSGMVPSYPQMMKVSRFYRSKNKDIKIIFGGWGPTSIYYEVKKNGNDQIDLNEHILQFCDAAVIGEAELVIDELLDHLEQGVVKEERYYVADSKKWDNNNSWVMPDFTIWEKGKYPFGAIQTQRGCPHKCEFCSVASIYNGPVRTKPVYSMVRPEIKLMQETHKFDMIFFYDDDIIGAGDGKYARKLFTMFKNCFPRLTWASQCTTRLLEKKDLMDLFRDSGCALLLIGFESLMKESIEQMKKKQNYINETDEVREKRYRKLIEELKARRIETWGAFIYGGEQETKEIFRRTLKFAIETGVLIYQASILTPQPGTPLFKEMRGRLLYPQKPEYWGHYDFLQPTLKYHSTIMGNTELMERRRYTYKVFYKKVNIISMARKSRIPSGLFRRSVISGILGGLRNMLRL